MAEEKRSILNSKGHWGIDGYRWPYVLIIW